MIQRKTIFHEDWWLNATAGVGNWGETKITNKNIVLRWRYQIKKYFGKTFLLQPQLTPFLGPWFEFSQPMSISYSEYDKAIDKVITKLPKHSILSQAFGRDFKNGYSLIKNNLRFIPQYTYIYSLKNKDALYKNLNKSTKRYLNYAIKNGLTVNEEDNFGALESLSQKTYAYQSIQRPYTKDLLEKIYYESLKRKQGKLLISRNKFDEVCSCAFLVSDNQTSYYLIGGIDRNKREFEHSMKLILIEAMKQSFSDNKIFDFEGSMNPKIENFFRGFGGDRKQYFYVRNIQNKYLRIADYVRRNIAY